MPLPSVSQDAHTLLSALPVDGTPAGNIGLRNQLGWDEARYETAREELETASLIVRGRGKGGSLARLASASATSSGMLALGALEGEMFAPETVTAFAPVKTDAAPKATKKAAKIEGMPVTVHQYSDATRKNLPPAGLAVADKAIVSEKQSFAYDPHLTPVLRFDESGATDELTADAEALLKKAQTEVLSAEEIAVLTAALRARQPWLEWAGKQEQPTFEVDPVALHIHERVSAQAILAGARREHGQRDFFADPRLDAAQASQFYKYDVDWANRLILGDSLQVMSSLSRREGLAGKVQMIYFDPPYGIKFSSNWQNEVGNRDVQDKDEDLSREPEMIRAYRDTWTLGVHSYLAYLKQRLILARDLLTDSGSIFVQISDENLHRVRAVMDEVFGAENFVSLITFSKNSGATDALLASPTDYILWYAKRKEGIRYRQIYHDKSAGSEYAERYEDVLEPTGARRRISEAEKDPTKMAAGIRLFTLQPAVSQGYRATTSVPFSMEGFTCDIGKQRNWKTSIDGLARLAKAERMSGSEKMIYYRRFLDDFPAYAMNSLWSDTQDRFAKQYIVQTVPKIIQRCMMMTTDPGDLVLDPTCGSGTTAYVAEQWGRRWITIDSSRVAAAIARQRLLTACFDTYKTKDPSAGVDPSAPLNPRHGFTYRSVPHITLKSIAQNKGLDPIFARHEPVLAEKLTALNAALKTVTPAICEVMVAKLVQKHREEGANAVADADQRRWLLPDTNPELIQVMAAKRPFKGITPGQVKNYRVAIPEGEWKEWEVPFDTDADWPKPLAEALTAYRAAWRAKMDEVNACIQANAEQEDLVDQPIPVPGVVRVSGPFTVESVRPLEDSMIGAVHAEPSPIGGSPNVLQETFETEETEDTSRDISNASSHIDRMIALLRHDGVRFPNNKHLIFTRLDPVDAEFIHAEGTPVDQAERRVAVVVGPEHGAITGYQVERAKISAYQRGYDEVIFAGFAFDASSQDRIQEAQAIAESGGGPHFLMAHIRPDVLMGDLLKGNKAGKKAATAQASQQIFTVFGQPRTKIEEKDGELIAHMEGVDIYDPVNNCLEGTKADKVAAWFLDTDYDGRTFHVCQAFFPDKSAWEKIAKALGSTVDESVWETFASTSSLPFAPGKHGRVAIKVIDPRGNEVMAVHRLGKIS
jgi:adenine-specific DNA-methyltransferase